MTILLLALTKQQHATQQTTTNWKNIFHLILRGINAMNHPWMPHATIKQLTLWLISIWTHYYLPQDMECETQSNKINSMEGTS